MVLVHVVDVFCIFKKYIIYYLAMRTAYRCHDPKLPETNDRIYLPDKLLFSEHSIVIDAMKWIYHYRYYMS